VWTLFVQDFHFLPDTTSEPERLAKLIQHLIWEQRRIAAKPMCSRHQIFMVMLGLAGWSHVKPKQRLSMSTIGQVGNGGELFVANGLFRCPHPGCYFVAPIESNDLLSPA
jgi:hypothetical protein